MLAFNFWNFVKVLALIMNLLAYRNFGHFLGILVKVLAYKRVLAYEILYFVSRYSLLL